MKRVETYIFKHARRKASKDGAFQAISLQNVFWRVLQGRGSGHQWPASYCQWATRFVSGKNLGLAGLPGRVFFSFVIVIARIYFAQAPVAFRLVRDMQALVALIFLADAVSLLR